MEFISELLESSPRILWYHSETAGWPLSVSLVLRACSKVGLSWSYSFLTGYWDVGRWWKQLIFVWFFSLKILEMTWSWLLERNVLFSDLWQMLIQRMQLLWSLCWLVMKTGCMQFTGNLHFAKVKNDTKHLAVRFVVVYTETAISLHVQLSMCTVKMF